MEYLRLIQELKKPMLVDGAYLVDHFRRDAALAITDLLARVEAAEARAEKAERERNAAVNDIEHVLKSLPYGDFCGLCAKAWDDCDEGTTGVCNPVWAGLREEQHD